MRVFICADMEGVSGVVSRRQTDAYDTREYARACEWFQQDVATAVATCIDAGASEVVIADSHGPATNLDPSLLPPEATLVQGWPRPLNMMQGIDAGAYNAAILLGHHTAITSSDGNFPHSFSSGHYRAVRVNGVAVSEGQVNAWLAGHFGVPVVTATGDDACMRSLAQAIPGLCTAVTKHAHGMYSATSLNRKTTLEAIAHAVGAGLRAADTMRPTTLPGPVDLELSLANRYFAELLSYLPEIERRGAFCIGRRVADICEAVGIIGALLHLEADCH